MIESRARESGGRLSSAHDVFSMPAGGVEPADMLSIITLYWKDHRREARFPLLMHNRFPLNAYLAG